MKPLNDADDGLKFMLTFAHAGKTPPRKVDIAVVAERMRNFLLADLESRGTEITWDVLSGPGRKLSVRSRPAEGSRVLISLPLPAQPIRGRG